MHRALRLVVHELNGSIVHQVRNHVCPFHMAQDQIQEGAALIFVTYQQLLDPIIRRSGGLEQVRFVCLVSFSSVALVSIILFLSLPLSLPGLGLRF